MAAGHYACKQVGLWQEESLSDSALSGLLIGNEVGRKCGTVPVARFRPAARSLFPCFCLLRVGVGRVPLSSPTSSCPFLHLLFLLLLVLVRGGPRSASGRAPETG